MTSWRQGNKEVKFSQINTFKRIKAWTKKKKKSPKADQLEDCDR